MRHVEQAGIPWLARGWERPAPRPEPMLTYDFPLRPDLLAPMRLPVRLSTEDAARIVQFIEVLAFGEAAR